MAQFLNTIVPPLFPEGPLWAAVYGEAPGPRGADRSGIPFWGDAAGRPLWQGLARAGVATVPPEVWDLWSGESLRTWKLYPVLQGVMVSNSYSVIPTSDGTTFRAPSKAEIQSKENIARILDEIHQCLERLVGGTLTLVPMGGSAKLALEHLRAETLDPRIRVVPLPHPSSRGLLSSAPNHGKGASLKDLQAEWEARLVEAVRQPIP